MVSPKVTFPRWRRVHEHSSTIIAENAGANAVVGNLGAVDPDPGDTFTFSLVSGVLVNAQFNISGTQLRARG